MNQYMLTLYGTAANWKKYSETEQKELYERYYNWANKLRKEERFVAGSELSAAHRDLLSISGKVVVDGPFPETKEILTGYFIIRAKSLEEAADVSKECPALSHGDWVQVYEMPKEMSK
jgi:hypothetical protein